MVEKIFENRIVNLNSRPVREDGHCVIYWMQKSHRAVDNLSLKFAIDRANDLGKPLLVYFGLYDKYPLASLRMFLFMLQGLKEVAQMLSERGIGFVVRRELPAEGIVRVSDELKACMVVVDEDYLNVGRSWREAAASQLEARLVQVDADTIVPARAIGKEEWAAYTIRPKIQKALPEYFHEAQESRMEHRWKAKIDYPIDIENADPLELASSLDTDQDVPPAPHFTGGHSEAVSRLNTFITDRLHKYKDERNEIGVSVSSDLSPYIHFGQLSPLRAALEVEKADAPDECIDAFLEQVIVRRDLGINFCLYNHNYDKLAAAPDWAKETLDKHRDDPRYEVYELSELEQAKTHDDLWNASQMELLKFGKIHPYMRMVWAKKLLEWSDTPEDALWRANYMNDKYALDGRDPNGYTNIAWCIYGKHDRPFPERPVFGKVRYMSSESTKKKFDWQSYIQRISKL